MRTCKLGVLFALALLVSCTGQQGTRSEMGAAVVKQNASAQATRRDLSLDEARGGHTLKKHVGKSDDELRERLERERNISAASSYTDRATAETVVAAALKNEADRVQSWAARVAKKPNLALDYRGDERSPVGRTMRRGDTKSEPCSNAVVVLRADSEGYYVLTSYPECR